MHSQKTNVARWRAALTCDNARKGPFVSILAKPLSYPSINTLISRTRVPLLIGQRRVVGLSFGSPLALACCVCAAAAVACLIKIIIIKKLAVVIESRACESRACVHVYTYWCSRHRQSCNGQHKARRDVASQVAPRLAWPLAVVILQHPRALSMR